MCSINILSVPDRPCQNSEICFRILSIYHVCVPISWQHRGIFRLKPIVTFYNSLLLITGWLLDKENTVLSCGVWNLQEQPHFWNHWRRKDALWCLLSVTAFILQRSRQRLQQVRILSYYIYTVHPIEYTDGCVVLWFVVVTVKSLI